ncbi:MAG: NAD-dependent epimerase/dehydratase family protein [Myxococcota bacterium]
MNRILITGAAGFIGFHIARRLLLDGKSVIGIDAMIDNNDLWIKKIRLKILSKFDNFNFINKAVETDALSKLNDIDLIIHLAAISGIERFEKNYVDAQRLTIESAIAVSRFSEKYDIPVLFASSSSVYGKINKGKFVEDEKEIKPISKYAITKLWTEEIFKDNDSFSLGLRFFTVYGEYGRPDMAYFRFAKDLIENRPLIVFGRGIKRDFTYIGDVVESILLIMKNLGFIKSMQKMPIINIGCGRTVTLERIIHLIGKYLKREPVIIYKKARRFDIPYTCSDNTLLKRITGYTPSTDIDKGLKSFAEWFRCVLPYEIDKDSHNDLEDYLSLLYARRG